MDGHVLEKNKWQKVSRDETVISKGSVIGISKGYSGNSDMKNMTRVESLWWDQWKKKTCKNRFVINYESLTYLAKKMGFSF